MKLKPVHSSLVLSVGAWAAQATLSVRKQTNVGFSNSLEMSWRAANGAHKTVTPHPAAAYPCIAVGPVDTMQAACHSAPVLVHLYAKLPVTAPLFLCISRQAACHSAPVLPCCCHSFSAHAACQFVCFLLASFFPLFACSDLRNLLEKVFEPSVRFHEIAVMLQAFLTSFLSRNEALRLIVFNWQQCRCATQAHLQ